MLERGITMDHSTLYCLFQECAPDRDKATFYGATPCSDKLKAEGKFRLDMVRRQVKRLIKAIMGFKSMKTAYVSLKRFQCLAS